MTAIHRLLKNSPFAAEQRELVAAFEQCLKMFGLTDREDPITDMIARKIMEIRKSGERDPDRIARIAVNELGPAPP